VRTPQSPPAPSPIPAAIGVNQSLEPAFPRPSRLVYTQLLRRTVDPASPLISNHLSIEGVAMKIAFLGLGIMGRPMAANLVKAGNEVKVWNRTPKDVPGATTAKTPADAAEGADVVWMCVADTAAVERVLFAPDGVESKLRKGVIVVDSSTISPVETVKFADRV